MLNLKIFTLITVIFIASFSVSAQYKKESDTKGGVAIFPVSELKEGMRGTARTVFRGNKSEEFNVEILGVVPNWIGPGQDIIVGRLSGANAERTSVFAGMSGSPVYIDGKLVGAISYSFPFAKEPMCGITPFAQMVSVVEQGTANLIASNSAPAFSFSQLASDSYRPDLRNVSSSALASGFSGNSRLMAIAGQTMTPIATPLTFSGISQSTIDMFAPELMRAGMLPVAAAGGGSGITKMKPADATTLLGGDSVVVQLTRGDIEISAAGTVTLRDGAKIYAFGHPFFSLGSANLPMAESHVVTVVPNTNNSFKLAVADSMVGAMTQDRATGIYGMLGEQPKMLPVKINLTTSRGRTEQVNFEAAFDTMLTPLLVNVGIANTMAAHERSIGDMTLELTGEIAVRGEEPIRFNRRFTGGTAPASASTAVVVPLHALLKGNFEGMEISGLTVNLRALDSSKTAVVDRITADRNQVRAGETIELTAAMRTPSGRIVTEKIPIVIPQGVAPGTLSIMIGDGSAVQKDTAVTQFVPRSARELIATINRLKRPDKLYAVLSRTTTGAIVGSNEMPNLPPSVLATMNNDRTAGGSKATVQTIVSEVELPRSEFIVTGSQTLTIEVVK